MSTRIGIAIVEHEGCILVGVRGVDVPLPGKAEFPGGKCLANESPADCAARECLEETSLKVRPVRLLETRTHEYPNGPLELHFWLCEPLDAQTVRVDHQGFRWVPREELKSLDFPEANECVVQVLSKHMENHGLDQTRSLDG